MPPSLPLHNTPVFNINTTRTKYALNPSILDAGQTTATSTTSQLQLEPTVEQQQQQRQESLQPQSPQKNGESQPENGNEFSSMLKSTFSSVSSMSQGLLALWGTPSTTRRAANLDLGSEWYYDADTGRYIDKWKPLEEQLAEEELEMPPPQAPQQLQPQQPQQPHAHQQLSPQQYQQNYQQVYQQQNYQYQQ
jgi:hypothetical protein